jgi:hypothetical protein
MFDAPCIFIPGRHHTYQISQTKGAWDWTNSTVMVATNMASKESPEFIAALILGRKHEKLLLLLLVWYGCCWDRSQYVR